MDAGIGVVVRECDVADPPQGASYLAAISDTTVGARSLWFGLVKLAPGSRTKAHTHPHETGIYLTKGSIVLYTGSQLQSVERVREREFALIPADVPHVAVNASADTLVVAVVARSDPAHDEPADLTPELDALVP